MGAASGVLGWGVLGRGVLGGPAVTGPASSATQVTVTGLLVVQPDVPAPPGSTVTVQLSERLYDLAGQQVIGTVPQTVRVNGNGAWQITLWATDDPTTTTADGGLAYYTFSFRLGTTNFPRNRYVSYLNAPTVAYEDLEVV